MRRLAMLSVFAALALPAYGQGNDFKDLLSGSAYPLTLKLKDLNSDWRRFTVSSGGESAIGNLFSMVMGAMLGNAGGRSGAYYSKGQTALLGGETFIVAYRVKTKPMDVSALMKGNPFQNPPVPEKLTEDSLLSLSLLSVRGVGSLDDIRPFDMKQEIEEHEKLRRAMEQPGSEEEEATPESDPALKNLKQMGMALLMYTQDYDEVLPPMQNMETVKKVLMPYTKNETIFTNPATKEPFKINPILSKRKIAHISNPEEFVVFYEANPGADGKRGVAFLDGHVERVSEADWPQFKKASKIP